MHFLFKIVDFSLTVCYNGKRKGVNSVIFNYNDLSFGILSVIRVKHRDGYFKVGGRPYAALSYRVRGSGEFSLDQDGFLSEAGDLLFVPEGASYEVEYSGTEMIVVHLSNCTYRLIENIKVADKHFLRSRFVEMLSLWEDRHATMAVKSLIFDMLQRLADGEGDVASDEVATNAARIMTERATDPDFDIAELARELYVSGATLRRRFSDAYGIPPKQYLTKLRLDRALALLASGHHLVKDAALMCGFSDEKYFSRAFKKKYGRKYKIFPITAISGDGTRELLEGIFEKLKDREHRYYACPKCRQPVRVPRGKGKIAITCPKCKERFIKKT